MAQRAGHEQFLKLLEEHKKILFKIANSYCHGPADREDLVQEMVMQLWRSFGRYDARVRFSTWTYRVASTSRSRSTGMRLGDRARRCWTSKRCWR